MPNRHSKAWFFLTAAITLAIDQAGKVLAVALLRERVPVSVLGDFVRFIRTANPQGLFGMNYGPKPLYFALPIVGMALVVFFALKSRERLPLLAYGSVLGGALGNLIDRVRFGSVVDFIDMGIGSTRWYTFNPADAFILFGIVLLLGNELFRRRRKTGQSEPGTASAEESARTSNPG